MRILALVLLLAAAAWRILAPHVPELNNFSPLMALAFCGGMYFRNRWMWLVPFGALLLSDLYLDHYYWVEFHYRWTTSGAALLGASLLFFLVTNTASWFGDGYYAHTAAGWWQAMTVGHPQFPSTLYFYRNTLASDLLFTGVFGLAMEYAAWREGKPSLLGKHA